MSTKIKDTPPRNHTLSGASANHRHAHTHTHTPSLTSGAASHVEDESPCALALFRAGVGLPTRMYKSVSVCTRRRSKNSLTQRSHSCVRPLRATKRGLQAIARSAISCTLLQLQLTFAPSNSCSLCRLRTGACCRSAEASSKSGRLWSLVRTQNSL